MNTYSITEIAGSENWEHEITAASFVVHDGFLYLNGDDDKAVAIFAPGHWSSIIEHDDEGDPAKEGEGNKIARVEGNTITGTAVYNPDIPQYWRESPFYEGKEH